MSAKAVEDPQNLNGGVQTAIMMILSLMCFLIPFFVNNLFDLEEKTQKISNFMNSLFIDLSNFVGILCLPPLILDLELFIAVGYYSILPLNMSNISYSCLLIFVKFITLLSMICLIYLEGVRRRWMLLSVSLSTFICLIYLFFNGSLNNWIFKSILVFISSQFLSNSLKSFKQYTKIPEYLPSYRYMTYMTVGVRLLSTLIISLSLIFTHIFFPFEVRLWITKILQPKEITWVGHSPTILYYLFTLINYFIDFKNSYYDHSQRITFKNKSCYYMLHWLFLVNFLYFVFIIIVSCWDIFNNYADTTIIIIDFLLMLVPLYYFYSFFTIDSTKIRLVLKAEDKWD
ncbi:hypothetical protein F8M41_017737 [Gigaspora margarita]|uniref:Uncharacterized protein n=1 Tax=Gigaspora margarita TaxID=4874 RepID=A0A8H4ELU6_GIGMA|nr:hypothetical protein F8M41_017737 [Gigaspora margarita]